MPENMMCKAHKATNQASRDGWDETFLPIGKRVIPNTHTARMISDIKNFGRNPPKVIFDPVNYGVIGLSSLEKAAEKALAIEEQFSKEE